MAGTFDVLRANDLIFNYVVSNWLMGQDPPAFDILAWNADSTRMPAAMHSFYLRTSTWRTSSRRASWRSPARTIDLSVDQVADLRGQRDQRPHRAVAVVLQDDGPGQRRRCASCSAAAGTSPASSTRPDPRRGTWSPTRRRLPASRRGVARGAERGGGSWWEDWARWSAEHSRARCRTRRAMGSRTPSGDRAGELRADLTRRARLTAVGRSRAALRPAGALLVAGAGRRSRRSSGALRPPARGTGCGRRWPAAPCTGCRSGPSSWHAPARWRRRPRRRGRTPASRRRRCSASSSHRVTATRVSRVTASARRNRSGEVTVCGV